MADLCCGSAGFTIAGHQTGRFTTVYLNDMDKDCRRIGAANHLNVDCRPLADVPDSDLPRDVDLITAGPPCQSFSAAGSRRGLGDPRADTFEHVFRVAKTCQPRWLACENVPGLLRMQGGAVFEHIQALAQQYLPGWPLKWTVYDTATHTMLPQHRERLYMVWFRESSDADRFVFAEPAVVQRSVQSLLLNEGVGDQYYNVDKKLAERAGADVVVARGWSGRTPRVYTIVPTLTTNHQTPVVVDSRGPRRLTPRECFRLQGFPDTYQMGDLGDGALYRIAGNAVTVPVAELVLESMAALVPERSGQENEVVSAARPNPMHVKVPPPFGYPGGKSRAVPVLDQLLVTHFPQARTGDASNEICILSTGRVQQKPRLEPARMPGAGDPIDAYFTNPEVIEHCVAALLRVLPTDSTYVDFSAGVNDFAVQLGKPYAAYDLVPYPRTRGDVHIGNWLEVQELPARVAGDNLCIGFNPPFGYQQTTLNKFVRHAASFQPRWIALLSPTNHSLLKDEARWYEIVHAEQLPHNSFYLPGSGEPFSYPCKFTIFRRRDQASEWRREPV